MRRLTVFPVLCLLLLSWLMACAQAQKTAPPFPSPPPSPVPEMASPPDISEVDYREKTITVWYGTNRKYSNIDISVPYTNKRDNKLNFGQCQVYIPKSHLRGSLGGGFWDKVRGIDAPIEFKGANAMLESEFWAAMQAALAQYEGSDRRLLVFIHGYNNSFVDAAKRTAQIWADLGVKGEPAFFSWPSRGDMKLYTADEATVEASEEYLTEFLVGLMNKLQAEQVHVIAHSMGNRALLRVVSNATALARVKTGKPFSQIFLAAPDVDLDVFNRLAKAYKDAARQTTLYVSKKDRAVFVSENLLHGYARVGAPPPYPHELDNEMKEIVDTVDVNAPQGLWQLGHAFFAEYRPVLDDIKSLIVNGTPSQARKASASGNYWMLGP